MKNVKIVMLALLGAVFTFSSCKYEEGPAISLKSKKARMANTWRIESAMADGEDVTEDYDQYELQLLTDGDARLVAIYTWNNFTFEYETDGTWKFVENKEMLELDMQDDEADKVYQILRLATDELWLREKGNEVELHLVPR